jgi:hypothetical protein
MKRGKRQSAKGGPLIPTKSDINTNIAAGTFFRVDKKNGGKATLSIRGAKTMWSKNPNFVYVPGVNIAGDLKAVTEALTIMSKGAKYNREKLLQGAITKKNYNIPISKGGQKENYQELFDLYSRKQEVLKRDMREGINSAGKPFVTLDMLGYILENIMTEENTGQVSKRGVSNRSRAKTLVERIKNLPQGKVLDVSKIREDGKGAITIQTPRSDSPKIGISKLRIVSDNIKALQKALEIYSEESGKDVTQLAAEWIELSKKKKGKGFQVKTRKGKEKLEEEEEEEEEEQNTKVRRRITPVEEEEEEEEEEEQEEEEDEDEEETPIAPSSPKKTQKQPESGPVVPISPRRKFSTGFRNLNLTKLPAIQQNENEEEATEF